MSNWETLCEVKSASPWHTIHIRKLDDGVWDCCSEERFPDCPRTSEVVNSAWDAFWAEPDPQVSATLGGLLSKCRAGR